MVKRRTVALVCVLILTAIQLGVSSERPLQPQSRLSILRELLAEFATLKKDLPRGSEGLHLGVDGKIDEKALAIQLTNQGPAGRTGELVQITKVDFKKDRIIFEINGGDKNNTKWYQRVEVGVGNSTQPVSPNSAEKSGGSSISLEFGRNLVDMTAGQLKQYLEPVLDFSVHSASIIIPEKWPEEISTAVKNHQLAAGMTRDMVMASKGRPDNKIREKVRGIEQETWVYGKVPSKILLVIFENDVLVEAREYTPGVPATPVPR